MRQNQLRLYLDQKGGVFLIVGWCDRACFNFRLQVRHNLSIAGNRQSLFRDFCGRGVNTYGRLTNRAFGNISYAMP